MTLKATLACLLLLLGARVCNALTIVIDFNDTAQGNTTDIFGNIVSTFSVTSYGFLESDRTTIYDSIMLELDRDYHDIPTFGTDPLSPIPDNMELDVDLVVGDIGSLPSNGDPEYFYVQVGTRSGGTACTGLGCANVNGARTSSGGFGSGTSSFGSVLGSIFTDNINAIGFSSPYTNVLTTGDLSATTHAINGTLAHEIGHTLSLRHIRSSDAVTPNSLPPLMGTGAIDLPVLDRIFDREFSYAGFNPLLSGTPATSYVSQLVSAIGLREVAMSIAPPNASVPEPSSLVLLAGLSCWGIVRRRSVRKRGNWNNLPMSTALNVHSVC